MAHPALAHAYSHPGSRTCVACDDAGKTWQKLGAEADHYDMPHKDSCTARTLTFKNGASIHVVTQDDRLQGLEFDTAWVDEKPTPATTGAQLLAELM